MQAYLWIGRTETDRLETAALRRYERMRVRRARRTWLRSAGRCLPLAVDALRVVAAELLLCLVCLWRVLRP